MENFIFSLNIVLPIFFLILMGILLKKLNILTEGFCNKATTLVFYVALPCSLFRSLAGADLIHGVDFKFVVFIVLISLLLFLLGWLTAVLMVKDRSQISAVAHGAYRGNFAYVGLAVITSLMGTDALVAPAMVIAFTLPMYNVLAIILLSYYNPEGGKPTVRKILKDIIKNPMIIGIVLALPFSLLQIPIISVADKTLSYLAQLSTPLALLLIGSNIRLDTFQSRKFGILLSSVFKIVIAPVLCTAAAILMGFRGEELVTAYVMSATPSAANVFIMTKKMGGDAECCAGIVTVTSLGSVVTLTIGIFILRSVGLI